MAGFQKSEQAILLEKASQKLHTWNFSGQQIRTAICIYRCDPVC